MRRAPLRLPQPPRRPSTRLMLSLSSVALLSACGGGGEEEIDLASYLPNFSAPPAMLANLFTDTALGVAGVDDQSLQMRLDQPEYTQTQTTIEWLRGWINDSTVSGQLYALKSSGAAFAHQAGITGKSQLIAMSDDYMFETHTALGDPRVDVQTNGSSAVDKDGNPKDHGTTVASVAIGFESGKFVGTAPDSSILFGTYETETDLANLGREALNRRAVAWNNSWGYVDFDATSTIFATSAEFNAIFVQDSAGADYLDSLQDYADYGVVVFAVSNDDSNKRSGIMDALPLFDNGLEAGWLAVVNGVPKFQNGALQSVDLISSACWQAARWCLAADGTWNAAEGGVSQYGPVTGSSFAAPQVSGGLALLAEAFPDLTPHQLRVRLLASAEDDFFAPDGTVQLIQGFNKPYSVIYGHGFLDIEAALNPIGGVGMPTAAGEQIAVDAPILLTGSGLGDAVEVSLASTNLAVKDALSAGFVMPGSALTAGARPGSQAGALLAKALRSNLAADRIASPAALDDPFAAFTGPVLELSAPDGTASAAVLVPQSGAAALGFTLTRVLTDGPTKVELGLKLARDDGGLLSLGGTEGAAMASVALGVTQDLGNGAFMAVSGEMGLTDLGGDTALGNTSSARFDAVKLTAGQSDIFTKGDRLSVGVGMPIAIASGETVLDLPVSRAGLAASFEGVALDLAPENRQRDLELTYQTALADGLEMKLSLIHSDNFGNRAGETDTAGALAFAFRF